MMVILILWVAFAIQGACGAVQSGRRYEDFNLLAYRAEQILIGNNSLRISTGCQAHLDKFRRSLISLKLEDFWAKQMFDARSKIPTGLLKGNIADLGSFDECMSIEAHISQSETIYGKYCVGVIPLNLAVLFSSKKNANYPQLRFATPQGKAVAPDSKMGLFLATCLPHSCSVEDADEIYSGIGMVFYEQMCQSKFSQPKLDGGSIATIVFLGVVLLIMALSTAYDYVLHYQKRDTPYSILIAFSMLTNGKKIISTTSSNRDISCLHGIRVITTMWVIVAHRFSIQGSFPMGNLVDALQWQQKTASMYIMGATVTVDTFFLIAGVVIVYSYMNAVSKGVKFNIIMFYVHRYLRLTPVLAVVVLIHLTLFKHLGSGPLWPYMVNKEIVSYCEKYWWKALLYIQNYGKAGGFCIPQSWYLSVDMQLFILAPLLLVTLNRWPKISLAATGVLTVCSILTCFLVGWFFKLNQNQVGNALLGGSTLENFMSYYYTATPTRAAPWLIGILVGYAIFTVKRQRKRLVINKYLMFSGWLVSMAILCTAVFVGHDLIFSTSTEDDRLANSLHLAIVRPFWGIAVGFIIFACVTGYGGVVNKFLSIAAFQILSKLTFTLYLLHYIVIYFTTAQMRIAPRFSTSLMWYAFLSDFLITLVISVIFTLAFESPIITIEKLLFGKATKSNGNQQPSSTKQDDDTAPAQTA